MTDKGRSEAEDIIRRLCEGLAPEAIQFKRLELQKKQRQKILDCFATAKRTGFAISREPLNEVKRARSLSFFIRPQRRKKQFFTVN